MKESRAKMKERERQKKREKKRSKNRMQLQPYFCSHTAACKLPFIYQ